MNDWDGLNELFDKGAYRKGRRLNLRRLLDGFAWRKLETHMPLAIAFLYVVSGDYISLLRHLQMVL
jgi:hypothetical protein